MNRNFLTALIFPVLAALFQGCEDSSSTTSPDPADTLHLGDLEFSAPYLLENGNLRFPSRILERVECEDGRPITALDTMADESFAFELEADRLTVGTRIEKVDADARILHRETLERVGKGSGIPGTWKLGEVDYVVLSGTLSEDAKEFHDARIARYRNDLIDSRMYYVISDSVIRTYVDMALAERFRENWHADSSGAGNLARFDIEVTVVDRHSVLLVGGKSGERVTIRLHVDNGDEYSSSDPGHAPYRYDEADPDCSQGSQPDWYGMFLVANAKVNRG